MKNLKTLSIIAIVLIGLFATSCTPENLDNDQTEQQSLEHKITDQHKRIKIFFDGSLVAYLYGYYSIFVLFL